MNNKELVETLEKAIKFLGTFEFRHARDELERLESELNQMYLISRDKAHRRVVNEIYRVVQAIKEKVGRPKYDVGELQGDLKKLQELKEPLSKLVVQKQ